MADFENWPQQTNIDIDKTIFAGSASWPISNGLYKTFLAKTQFFSNGDLPKLPSIPIIDNYHV